MVSFIIPAHNEQAYLSRTLEAIHVSARALGRPYEAVVVDDASTDATAEVACRNDARVIRVHCRQIAAARNAGARAARGDCLFFVDADTLVSPHIIASAIRALEGGAIGGGAPARFDRGAPLWARLVLWEFSWLLRFAGMCGGACMFCTRQAFEMVGGYNERLFGAEDVAMSWALGRVGRFAVLWDAVITSSRRTHGVQGARTLAGMVGMGFFPQLVWRRSGVRKIWYGSDREEADRNARSIASRILDNVLLLLLLSLLPIWNLIPWSLTPHGTVVGEVRWGFAIFACHMGLLLWPCAFYLLRHLVRHPRWPERMRLAGLAVVCVWAAWPSTTNVVWFWMWVVRGLSGAFPG